MKQVGLPIFYFRKTAKREYSDWKTAIPREFFQNSSDAHCSEFHVNVSETDTHTILSVKDNGRGMFVEDCENKLLTMGGTGKEENSVGGFGIAKGLLFFAWDKWEIRSKNYIVTGEGCQYDIAPSDTYVYGVNATIYIDKAEGFCEDHVRNYLARCETHVRIFINDVPFKQKRSKGKRIKTLEWASLYKRKTEDGCSVRSPWMAVRVNGMHMFNHFVDNDLDCRLTLELVGNTRDLMTSNRDGLKAPYNGQLQTLARDISINVTSALDEKEEVIIQKFKGTGLERASMPKKKITSEQIAAAVEHVANIFDGMVFAKTDTSTQIDLPVLDPVLSEIGTDEEEESLQDFPDIIVHTVGKRLSKKFNPKTWPYKVKTIMKLWVMVLKHVMLDNKIECEFGVGITNDPIAEAAFTKDGETPYFLLNLETWGHTGKSKTGKTLLPKVNGKNGWMLIQELRQRAAHEIAHMISGRDHNEKFVAKVEEIESNTWVNENSYRTLPKLVSRSKSKKAIDVID